MERTTFTDKRNNISVYKKSTRQEANPCKRSDKSDLGPDFLAPDGGWGWIVCTAAGMSNLCMFPALQQYGLIYRKRMHTLDFDAKQTTTIVNVIMAVSSLVGIVNGAMFRRFTYRQVGFTGSLLVFIGLLCSAFCETFMQFIIFFSCIYGMGLGLTMAATSLAVNTYFKQRRRRATGFSWTITGLGPIIFPHISTFLLGYYGVQGTILLFSGIALNSLVCALTLQPVLWHVHKSEKPALESRTNSATSTVILKKATGTENITATTTPINTTLAPVLVSPNTLAENVCRFCQYQKRGMFSSQCLFNNDDPERPGYEITDPGTPMMGRANDGWFGSKLSLTSQNKTKFNRQNALRWSRDQIHAESGGYQDKESHTSQFYKPNYLNQEQEDFDNYPSNDSIYGADKQHCTCTEEMILLQQTTKSLKLTSLASKASEDAEDEAKRKISFPQKLVKFFDLDLLKDVTFVNLTLGMTIMMFGEMNFSVLTPFILNSFGFSDPQISLAMSLLGGMDISVRFLAPIALEKINLDNRVLFAFGIIAIGIGRLIVSMTNSYEVVLCVFVLIGFGKGFRTIFSPLIIPSYVPLNRLPAASGLQLIFNTIFSFAFGPILGIITDDFSYKMTIHFINCLTCLALLMWLCESAIRRILRRPPMYINE